MRCGSRRVARRRRCTSKRTARCSSEAELMTTTTISREPAPGSSPRRPHVPSPSATSRSGAQSSPKEVDVMKRLVAVIVVAALVVAASASVVIAQQSPAAERETLAQALKGAWLPLEAVAERPRHLLLVLDDEDAHIERV